jgi:hypothetical protein
MVMNVSNKLKRGEFHMRHIRTALICFTIIILVFLTGCGSTTLSGTYVAKDPSNTYDSFTFNSDGTGTMTDIGNKTELTYTISDGEIHLEFNFGNDLYNSLGNKIIPDFTFSQKGNSIYINNQQYVLQK